MSDGLTSPGTAVPAPQVVASYTAYLRTRIGAEPEVLVTGDRAEVSASKAGRELVLAFGHRNREWSLESAELRVGEQTVRFTRGKLAEAVTALLRAVEWQASHAREVTGNDPQDGGI